MILELTQTQTQIWLTSLPTVITSLATLVVAFTGFYQLQRNQIAIANAAATKVEKVKDDLAISNDKLHASLGRQEVQLNAVHKLVNSEYGIALRTGAAAL